MRIYENYQLHMNYIDHFMKTGYWTIVTIFNMIDAGKACIAQNERFMYGNFLFVWLFSICYHS